MKQPLDPAILARAKAGDARAFRALYEHCADFVHRFLVRMLGNEAAAEDATQRPSCGCRGGCAGSGRRVPPSSRPGC